MEPQSGFLGRRRRWGRRWRLPGCSFLVDVPAVPQLQYVDKVVAVPVVQVVRGLLFLFFDKVVDMPVIAQLQHVDKLVISLLCRSCVLRGEDSPIPQLAIIEKIVEVPEVQYTYDGRCPCCAGVRVAPVQVVVETAFSHSCFVEKLVENPRERVQLQRDHSAAGGGHGGE